MVYAIDFDGTLCKHEYPDIGEPNEKLIEMLKEIKAAGHKLILWTCRSGKTLDEAVAWCKEKGIEFDAVNDDIQSIKDSDFGKEKSVKVFADVYIDDRAVLVKA